MALPKLLIEGGYNAESTGSGSQLPRLLQSNYAPKQAETVLEKPKLGMFRDDSMLGMAKNTITGLPSAGLDVAKKGFNLAKGIGNVILQTNPFVPGNMFDQAKKDAIQVGVDKTLNTEIGKKIADQTGKTTENAFLKAASVVQASSPEVTYSDAYKKWQEAKANPENPVWKNFLYNVQSTIPQSLIGVVLSWIPYGGKPLAATYWGALSADEQIKSKGQVDSLGNIGIDVAGDMILGNSLEGLFKPGVKSLKKTLLKNGFIEGSTESLQSLLKYGNDYQNAKTPEERKYVIDQAKNYVTSGDILMEFAVGATSGGIISGGAYGVSKMVGGQNNISAGVEQQSAPPKPNAGNQIAPASISEPIDKVTQSPVTDEPVVQPINDELDIPVEMEEEANTDWENNPAYGEAVGNLIDKVDVLEKELKAISKTKVNEIARNNIQKQIDVLNNKVSKIQDEFINKWKEKAKQVGPKPTTPKPPTKPTSLTIKPEIQEKGHFKITEIKGKDEMRPQQLVTKTQAKDMVKSLGGDVTFTYDGTNLNYKNDKTN